MKLYRDLNITYYLLSFAAAAALLLPPVLRDESILPYALPAFLCVFCLALVFQYLAMRRINKNMALLEGCRIKEYTAAYEKLLPRARKSSELLVKLNLSAGYIEQGYPRKALDLLRELPAFPKGRRGVPLRLCYDNNLAVCHRQLGDLDTAEKLLEQFRADLAAAPEKTPQLEQMTVNCRAQATLLRMARGDFDGARAFFEGKLEADTTERQRVADHYALAWVSLQEGDRAQSARHLEYVLAHGGDTWYVGAARERMRQLRVK
jgi:tetratricopeptide (TPR) repeat protein